jgi:hypothetical protein
LPNLSNRTIAQARLPGDGARGVKRAAGYGVGASKLRTPVTRLRGESQRARTRGVYAHRRRCQSTTPPAHSACPATDLAGVLLLP